MSNVTEKGAERRGLGAFLCVSNLKKKHTLYGDPDGHLVEVQSSDDPEWAGPE